MFLLVSYFKLFVLVQCLYPLKISARQGYTHNFMNKLSLTLLIFSISWIGLPRLQILFDHLKIYLPKLFVMQSPLLLLLIKDKNTHLQFRHNLNKSIRTIVILAVHKYEQYHFHNVHCDYLVICMTNAILN